MSDVTGLKNLSNVPALATEGCATGVSCLRFLMDPKLMLAFSNGLELLAAAQKVWVSENPDRPSGRPASGY
jgi:hypothetical protein